ncbi:MAG: AmmeMemoRadiSam system protein B, partial [Candidatus Omnitrophota bacterium]
MVSKKLIKFGSIVVIFLFACADARPQVKSYEFAGSWYPANPKILRNLVKRFIDEAEVDPIEGEILGVISPHAGYRYSGPVAGYSFKALKNVKFDTAIVMATTHKHYFSGVSIYPKGEFDTPLGSLKIDSKFAKELATLEFVKFEPKNFYGDHIVEMELPFLVQINPKAKIVPMMVGDISYEQLEELAQKLYQTSLRKDFIIIVSADLSHYQPYDEAVRIDSNTINLIERQDTRTLWDTKYFGQGRTCSMSSVVAFLNYARLRGGEVKKLHYANSGDTSGIKGSVVGYLSAVAYVPDKKTQAIYEKQDKKERGMKEFSLTDKEKGALLKIARSTLQSYLKEGKTLSFEAETETLKEKRGAFVTLKKKRQLRGCIGRIAGDTPLYKVIPEYAIHAATDDPRF